ncbi:hypothetical protein B0J18DRAFT_438424 [Chaetomium sp. MPI-SDFR-AT-0129]|nr:hypothetical protein B0J18DRAFT_438424 [Chaetomium sp. MPI-SDFR-AT-0129]
MACPTYIKSTTVFQPFSPTSYQSNTVTVRSIILSSSTFPTLDTYLQCYSCPYLKTYYFTLDTTSSTFSDNGRPCRCASEGESVSVSARFMKAGRDARKRQFHKQPFPNNTDLGKEAAKTQDQTRPSSPAVKPTKTKPLRRIFRLAKMLFGHPRADRSEPARSAICVLQELRAAERALARETAENTERNKRIPSIEQTGRAKKCHKIEQGPTRCVSNTCWRRILGTDMAPDDAMCDRGMGLG